MVSMIELTKDGVRVQLGGHAAYLVPQSGLDLLRLWHAVVPEIDPEYTLGDLLSLLRRAGNADHLAALLGCDVPSFLAEGRLTPTADDEDDGPDYLEVFNEAVATRYEEDPDNPDEPAKILEADEAEAHDEMMHALHELIGEPPAPTLGACFETDDPITGEPRTRRIVPGARHGKWCGPYHIVRSFRGVRRWREPYPGFLAEHPEIQPPDCGHACALGLVPVSEVAHRPLRYNPDVAFGDDSGRDALFRDRITFGELVRAVFDVIGIAGDPRTRDSFRVAIERRAAEIAEEIERELDGGGEPWRGNRSERRE